MPGVGAEKIHHKAKQTILTPLMPDDLQLETPLNLFLKKRTPPPPKKKKTDKQTNENKTKKKTGILIQPILVY